MSKFSPDPREVDGLFADVCEPCGGERVADIKIHEEKQMHKDNMQVVEDFSRYCDLREVCPVTCSNRDVSFYMELAFARRGRSGGLPHAVARPSRLLNVISRVHDQVQGQELLGVPDLEDKVAELLSKKQQGKFQYVCYTCPWGADDMESLTKHVRGAAHANAARFRTVQKAGNYVKCVPCNMLFCKPQGLFFHRYSPEHLIALFDEENNPDDPGGSKVGLVGQIFQNLSFLRYGDHLVCNCRYEKSVNENLQ